MRASTASALVLAPLLVLSGCGDGTAGASAQAPQPAPATSTASPPASSPAADPAADPAAKAAQTQPVAKTLKFTGTTLEGAAFDGASLAGRPAVLWFWAPWCSTCRAQAGGVSELAERFEGRVGVVGVGGLAEVPDIRAFAEKVSGPTHLIDDPGVVWRHFGVTAQSTYVLLDAAGKVVEQGYLDDEDLANKVEQLVG